MQAIGRKPRIVKLACASAVLFGLGATTVEAAPPSSQSQPFRARGTGLVGQFGTVVVPLTFKSGAGGADTNTTVPAGRVARVEYVNCSIILDDPLPFLFIPPGAALMVTDTDPNDFTLTSRTYLPLFDNRVPNVNSSIKAFAIASLTVNVLAGEFVTINFGSLAEGTFIECFAHGVFVQD